MNEQLHRDISARLLRDYGFKPSGTWLTKGKCPACDKKEMFTNAEHPWVLRCGRANRCGVEYHVKDIYADLFASWSDRYKATPEAPNAAADAYLQSARGFDLTKIAGWYAQENFYDPEKKIGTATVRFPLVGGAWWERFIDRPERFGHQKANFRGQYGGTWWQPPSLTGIPAELWIVEGIFNSIALLHHDIDAVSAMSSNNYPATALKALAAQCESADKPRPKLVWAFDAGRAGRKSMRKFAQRSRDEGWAAEAALVPMADGKEPDWNDMHQRGRLEPKDIEDYRYQGALLLAATAQEKALLMYRRHGWHSFSFEFDNKLWWFKLDLEKFHKACQAIEEQDKTLTKDQVRDKALIEAGLVTEIANFYPTALYYQENKLTDEAWYYFRIDFPHDGPAVKKALTPAQATKVPEFKARMFHAPGAYYTANAAQHDFMMKRWTEGIKKVETVAFIGYSPHDKEHQHGCWVFNDVAVKNGKMITLNDEDYFDIGGRLSIKSLSQSPLLMINTDPKEFTTDWLAPLWQCYHYKGIAALAFWLGSLFAVQIRQRHKSYPFIELVGEPGAGKSTLIEFLWRLLGRTNYEGFDPVKATMVARARNMMQVSNLPVVMIEGDRTDEDRNKQKGFDWDELKPVYDGRSVYSRGVKNNGNETIEPPFLGALVISQNAPVMASDAIMQRILHIGFDLASHTPESKAAADVLWQIPVENLSGFILKATLAEEAVLATFEESLPHHEQRLLKLTGVRNRRIALNHAMLAALVDALAHVVPLGAGEREQTQAFIEDMAAERQEAINADHQVVQEFWDIFDFLNGDDDTPLLNHARHGDEEIAINLNHFVAVAADRRQQIPDLRELKKLLKTSRVRKFIGLKPVNSAIHAAYNARKANDSPAKPSTVKCWVFKASTRSN